MRREIVGDDRPDREADPAADRLAWLSGAYLALPLLIFATGWMRIPFALPFAAAVVALLVPLARNACSPGSRGASRSRSTWLSVAEIAVVVLIAALLSGIGGFGYRNWDHEKHDAMLADLVRLPWPGRFPEADGAPLVYYVGWYLVPAGVGKVGGWLAANLALWIWSVLGLGLAAAWFVRATGPISTGGWRFFLFLFIGGWDVVGWMVHDGFPGLGHNLEHWNPYLRYPSPSAGLLWVPQQAIAAWILGGWLVTRGLARGVARDLPALLALGGLWTPWACVGLIPFAAWAAAREADWREIATRWTWIPALVVAIGLAVFYAAKAGDPTAGWLFARIAGREGWTGALRFYLLFLAVDVLPLVLLALPAVLAMPRRHASLAATAAASLVLIGLYRAGFYNDFSMRVSMPATQALAVLALSCVGPLEHWGPARVAYCLALMLPGFVAPMSDWTRSIRAAGFSYATPTPSRVVDLSPGHHVEQYVGRADSPFFTIVARPPESVKGVLDRPREGW